MLSCLQVSAGSSCRWGSVDVCQHEVEGAMQLATAVARRLQGEPHHTGQQSQSCSQEEAQEGWGELAGRVPAARGGAVEEEEETGKLLYSTSQKHSCIVELHANCTFGGGR